MTICHLWECSQPAPELPGAGFPVLSGAEHATVFAPTAAEGGFNHHAQLAWFDDRFYGMWSNHPLAEDGPGQRVLFSTSEDGRTWTEAQELFPPPGPVTGSMSDGLVLTAFGWYLLGDRLYHSRGNRIWALISI